MKKTFAYCVVLNMAFLAPLGCAQNEAPTSAPGSSENAQTEEVSSTESVMPEVDDEPLDVTDLDSPEGVVNEFFRSFFSGDSEGAFALLTSRAQNAKRDAFVAQENSVVRWRVTKKMKPYRGRVLVLVDVEDYTDAGAIQVDELTFVLTNDDMAWRIAGFSVGDLAVNFESSEAAVAAKSDDEFLNDELSDEEENDGVVRSARRIESEPRVVR